MINELTKYFIKRMKEEEKEKPNLKSQSETGFSSQQP